MGVWDTMTAFHQTGLSPVVSSANGQAPASSLPSAGAAPATTSAPPWHPDSGLFWFGAALAVTLGLIAASTSIRVGPFKAGVSAGDPK